MRSKYSNRFWLFLVLMASYWNAAANDLPVISNILTINDAASKTLTLRYSLQDAEEDSLEVLFRASFDEGDKFLVNTSNATGDIGWPVLPGAMKEIQWYYGDIWDDIEGKTLRLVADDGFEMDVAAILEQVDTIRMKALLSYIASARSFQVDEQHLYDVRDTIMDLFALYGYDVDLLEFTLMNRTATNVIGRKQGVGTEQNTIIMDAHYDSNIDAPGADDNGSGVVGFLEAARLLAPYTFDRSLEFIGFDQEEEGLLGSINYAYFGGIEPWETIEGVLNFEMIGYYSEIPNSQETPLGFDLLFPSQYAGLEEDEFRGNFIFVAGNDAAIGLVNAFESAASNYVEGLKVVSGIVPLNGLIAPDLLRSDHAPFWFQGLPALFITDGAEFRNKNYHQLTDVVDSIDFNFMLQVTQASIAAMIELAEPRHAAVEDFIAETVISGTNGHGLLDCGMTIYPNPAHDMVRVDLSSCVDQSFEAEATLYDTKGRQVMHRSFFDLVWEIDVTGLSCGTYLLEIRNGEGVTTTSILVN